MKLAVSRKNAWERLPRLPRLVLGPLIGSLPQGLLLGRRFRDSLRFADEAQWWSAERSREYQRTALQRLCRVAYESTGYYRDLFVAAGFEPGDLKSVEDLRRLPTLTAETVREHLTRMCAVAPRSAKVDYVSTAGTGGAPLGFYIGAERSPVDYAYYVSSWQRSGFRLGRRWAVFRGRVVAPDSDGLRHEYDPLLRAHFYSTFHMTDDDMRRYLEHVRGIGGCFLHVYPSSAAMLARFIRRAGIAPPGNVEGIIAESEIVYPEQRQMIEETFGRRVFSCYGMTEKVAAAAECEHSTDYHVWPTYGFCELLDAGGEPITTPGQRGEIVGTSFLNSAVPFLRYRTGDYATYLGDRCGACGRAHMLLRGIHGHRIQENLVGADGSLISWTALNMHDDTFINVQQFRFVQDTPGRAVLHVVPARAFNDEDRRRIAERIGRKLGDRVEVEVKLAGNLAAVPSGKAIYVDQRIADSSAEEVFS